MQKMSVQFFESAITVYPGWPTFCAGMKVFDVDLCTNRFFLAWNKAHTMHTTISFRCKISLKINIWDPYRRGHSILVSASPCVFFLLGVVVRPSMGFQLSSIDHQHLSIQVLQKGVAIIVDDDHSQQHCLLWHGMRFTPCATLLFPSRTECSTCSR